MRQKHEYMRRRQTGREAEATERQRDREIERRGDGEPERQRYGEPETERERDNGEAGRERL